MSLLALKKEELKYLTDKGLNAYSRELDRLEKRIAKFTRECGCPKKPHDCDNCSLCGTDGPHEPHFTADELEEIAEDTN